MAQLTDIESNPRGSHGPKSPLPALALTGVGVVEGGKVYTSIPAFQPWKNWPTIPRHLTL